MKIRLKHSIASPTWSYAIGDEIEANDLGILTPRCCPAPLARAWIKSGIAEEIAETSPPAAETADAPPTAQPTVQTAALKRKR